MNVDQILDSPQIPSSATTPGPTTTVCRRHGTNDSRRDCHSKPHTLGVRPLIQLPRRRAWVERQLRALAVIQTSSEMPLAILADSRTSIPGTVSPSSAHTSYLSGRVPAG